MLGLPEVLLSFVSRVTLLFLRDSVVHCDHQETDSTERLPAEGVKDDLAVLKKRLGLH